MSTATCGTTSCSTTPAAAAHRRENDSHEVALMWSVLASGRNLQLALPLRTSE
jgi:hypothetical protein